MRLLPSLSALLLAATQLATAADDLAWPPITREAKPWAYWWWMGSAVDPANLTRELEKYHDAGLGGVHIIPIYGAKGYEDRFIDYLSPKWMEMMRHSVTEAQRLGMGVDMTTGSGWCFGGPQISNREANALPVVKTFDVSAGGTVSTKVDRADTQALVAFSETGESIDLTDRIGDSGTVNWTAPASGTWHIYEVSQKPSGQKVKRAGPGSQGHMLNLFAPDAVRSFLHPFTSAFDSYSGPKPRAQYHDSYEYRSDWSPIVFQEFEKRRGYRLQNELPALFGKDESDRAARVKSDYRETLADIMTEESLPLWVDWSHKHGFLTRNEAHGSPGNLLDLYALADIPETEMFYKDRNMLVAKLASSAAHVTGRKLASSETGTWLKEHFTETLADMKHLVDELFLSGVNHIFYHGTCYSPDDAAWPGWVFYAATQMNPRNSIWRDVPALNSYIARCQSVLQSGRADNDVLLYWPIYDTWHEAKGMTQGLTVHSAESWMLAQPFGKTAEHLWQRGYAFDYISDRQLADARAENGTITTTGGAYRVVVVPACEHIPVKTLEQLLTLAESGATVIFESHLPNDVPGWGDLEKRRAELQKALSRLKLSAIDADGIQEAALGKGRVILGKSGAALARAKLPRESLVDRAGMLFIRRATDDGRYYLLVNRSESPVDGWVPLATAAASAAIMDPMTSHTGRGTLRRSPSGNSEIYLQLEPGESVILRTFNGRQINGAPWPTRKGNGEPIDLAGTWQVKFLTGGPELPSPVTTDRLTSWTEFGGTAAQAFAGTAVYTLHFDLPSTARGPWMLDLGDTRQSARVRLNGHELGTLIAPPFRVPVEQLQAKDNILEVEVTNLAANRIRDLDRRQVQWRNFYDTNFVNIDYKPFDASVWPVTASGLLGPVRLRPISKNPSTE